MIEARGTAAAIHEALGLERTDESASAVKRAVARSIEAVDVGVSIETTEYFNHSFAPDLVLKWERAPVQTERFVFLRFNDRPEWITEELPRIEGRHPVVYGLSPTTEGPETNALALRSIDSETLVTDPGGVDQLAAVPPRGIGSLVSRTLIRGGQGLVDRDRAARATSEIAAGFEAARAADPERTKVAADTAEEFLRPVERLRVLRFLQAMWVGSGASAAAFPAEAAGVLPPDPGDEGLKLLIEHEEIADHDFWRALGASLTIERLAKLGIHGAPPNLQHVVEANLDRLWARAIRVRPDQPRLDETERELIWRMEFNLLALGGSTFTAYLASAVDEITQIKAEKNLGVTVEDLRNRARGVSIDSLELTNGYRTVTYASSDQFTDVVEDEELSALTDALGSPTIQRATITVGGRHLELDFTTTTASARTSGRPPLFDILGVALPLLWPVSGRELRAFTSMMTSARDQQTLDLFSTEDTDDEG